MLIVVLARGNPRFTCVSALLFFPRWGGRVILPMLTCSGQGISNMALSRCCLSEAHRCGQHAEHREGDAHTWRPHPQPSLPVTKPHTHRKKATSLLTGQLCTKAEQVENERWRMSRVSGDWSRALAEVTGVNTHRKFAHASARMANLSFSPEK